MVDWLLEKISEFLLKLLIFLLGFSIFLVILTIIFSLFDINLIKEIKIYFLGEGNYRI